MKIVPMFVLAFSFLLVAQPGKKKVDPLLEKSTFTAKVVTVPEGDLIGIKLDKATISVRLVEIDAPETRQTFGRQARRFTHDLVIGKTVTVIVKMVDRYKRVVAEVILPDGRSLNQELVKWGYAWHYRVDPRPSKILASLEYQAWKRKLGLWVDPKPVPPWKFRGGTGAPEPPSTSAQIDYDEIFNYGLVGDPKTRQYQWPACRNYKTPPREEYVLFTSKIQAEDMGYRAAGHCPEE